MIKQLIILAQLLGLFFYQLLFTGDLTVTQNLQSSITQGEEAIVEITIDKGDLPGFAKVQQSFPDGFTAEPIETKGATFSFKDNKLKFIWMSLPKDEKFTISYKIVPDETVEGDFVLGGKFSFIHDSERQNVEIPVSNFKVIKKVEEVAAVVEEVANVASDEVNEPVIEEVAEVVEDEVVDTEKEEIVEEAKEALDAEEENVLEKIKNKSTTITPGTVFCKRSITPSGKGKYKVVVNINKGGVEGFCKITEKIPTGFIASEDNSNEGVFSFKSNTMKILWMGAPKEDSYSVSYFVEAENGTENGLYDIIGFYSYLENDATSKYIIDGTSFNLELEEILVEETVVVVPPTDVVNEEPVVEEIAEVIKEKVVEKEKEVEPVLAEKEVTSTPKPEGDVTYKVQVGAGHKTVPSTYFATVFKLRDKVSTINHEGWIKYLVGSFEEYKSARDKRNIVRSNVKTAFVTAYNSGTRITVQEALMISNQKWYK